jgi:predicted O-linked N-acetylglucosamine transferase (SPINDLY family)
MNQAEAQAFVDAWLVNGPPALPSVSELSIDDLKWRAQEAIDQRVWCIARIYLLELFARDYQPAVTATNLAVLSATQSRMDEAMDWYRRAVALNPTNREDYEHLVFLQDLTSSTTDHDALEERRRYFSTFGTPAYLRRKPHDNTPDPERPLKIGYVGGDWNFHSATIAFASVVSGHSAGYVAYAYSTLHPDHGDHVTREWKRVLGDRYLECYGLSPSQLAAVIRHDEMDILVDLAGYTARNRLLTFAEKPAPLQVQGWGYVLGSGFPTMDAIFLDPVVCPPEIEAVLSERVVRLPSILGFMPVDEIIGDSDLPCLTQPPVFGVFQRSIKINADNLRAYRRILEAVPDAKIMFKGGDYTPERCLQIVDALRGLEHRIIFAPPTSHRDHMNYYHQTDLSLDTWPQTGGVSTLESLFMNIPVLTKIGPRMIERTSASMLTNCHLTELIAETQDDYIEKAVRLVTTDKAILAEYRKICRTRLMASPIVVGYTAAVEDAYRMLWKSWCLMRTTDTRIH